MHEKMCLEVEDHRLSLIEVTKPNSLRILWVLLEAQ
jgi:hypothetical protein